MVAARRSRPQRGIGGRRGGRESSKERAKEARGGWVCACVCVMAGVGVAEPSAALSRLVMLGSGPSTSVPNLGSAMALLGRGASCTRLTIPSVWVCGCACGWGVAGCLIGIRSQGPCAVCQEAFANPDSRNNRGNPAFLIQYRPSLGEGDAVATGVAPYHNILIDVGKTFRRQVERFFPKVGGELPIEELPIAHVAYPRGLLARLGPVWHQGSGCCPPDARPCRRRAGYRAWHTARMWERGGRLSPGLRELPHTRGPPRAPASRAGRPARCAALPLRKE